MSFSTMKMAVPLNYAHTVVCSAATVRLRKEGSDGGYAVKFIRPSIEARETPDEAMDAALLVCEQAGWRVTKVLNDKWSKFILFTPAAENFISIRVANMMDKTLNKDEQGRLIVALSEQGFDLLSDNAYHIKFGKRELF